MDIFPFSPPKDQVVSSNQSSKIVLHHQFSLKKIPGSKNDTNLDSVFMQRASEVRILYKSARPAPQLPRDQAQMLRLQWRTSHWRSEVPEAPQPPVLPVTSHNLRILQLNIMKSRAGMEALVNDHQTINHDLLIIQEPPISAYRTHVNHSA
jgi:hypothetical protein